ncbi:5-carboxymethyl-2-hydroxymuconate Delta-isomerase [Pleionea sp. CnH1-48]|uniref:5-carboxymethyl-2-hydroxymuconate Delta-isomerase n=1 Tax=Pleionea sp. CnH1-48 TaxID=2954494 RepID=UPI00209734E8|nr:5-carboxymethyl-2-hydroxymuconate Delta-isomerase [Pleionea sp. CnH1-48]MCO7223080.1 5-carboxymethyl-2-hydroxymuconate Delta-isomerase [Pleionea sp. CnH1-48]
MPHCIIEHSNTIKGEELMPLVYESTLKSELFDMSGKDIKVRVIPYDHYQVGNQVSDFIHITLKILSGRTEEQKLHLSQTVLEHVKLATLNPCSISVEVIDIDRASYSKITTE